MNFSNWPYQDRPPQGPHSNREARGWSGANRYPSEMFGSEPLYMPISEGPLPNSTQASSRPNQRSSLGAVGNLPRAAESLQGPFRSPQRQRLARSRGGIRAGTTNAASSQDSQWIDRRQVEALLCDFKEEVTKELLSLEQRFKKQFDDNNEQVRSWLQEFREGYEKLDTTQEDTWGPLEADSGADQGLLSGARSTIWNMD